MSVRAVGWTVSLGVAVATLAGLLRLDGARRFCADGRRSTLSSTIVRCETVTASSA